MAMVAPRRLPVSVRHAFALAFDLSVRRDPVHSLIVPLILRAPWAIALVLLPPVDRDSPGPVLMVASLALIGDFLTALVVTAMLRVRARSVFHAAPDALLVPAIESYTLGIRRVPWLFATEAMRNAVAAVCVVPLTLIGLDSGEVPDLPRSLVLIATSAALSLPVVYILFRLGVATEAVVLVERDMVSALRSSFRLTRRRFERWFEMVLVTSVTLLVPAFFFAVVSLAVPSVTLSACLNLARIVTVALSPVVQYAWTYFYLRLVESDSVPPERPAPALPPLIEEPASPSAMWP